MNESEKPLDDSQFEQIKTINFKPLVDGLEGTDTGYKVSLKDNIPEQTLARMTTAEAN